MFKPAVAVLLCPFLVSCEPPRTERPVVIYVGQSSSDTVDTPACLVEYYFDDATGAPATLCVYNDTSDNAWNGRGASVLHSVGGTTLVGITVDLPLLCSGDYPVCAVTPSTRCVTPPEFWDVGVDDYALCRTNNGNDLLEVFAETYDWTVLATFDIATVCSD